MMVFNKGNGVSADRPADSESSLALVAVVVGKGEGRYLGICIDLIDGKIFVQTADSVRKGWYKLWMFGIFSIRKVRSIIPFDLGTLSLSLPSVPRLRYRDLSAPKLESR
jgi:hypothetical protein